MDQESTKQAYKWKYVPAEANGLKRQSYDKVFGTFSHRDKIVHIFGKPVEYSMDASGLAIASQGKIKFYPWKIFSSYLMPIDVEATRETSDLGEIGPSKIYEIEMSSRFFLRFKSPWHVPRLKLVFVSPSERDRVVEQVKKFLPHTEPMHGILHGEVSGHPLSSKFWLQFLLFLSVGLLVLGVVALVLVFLVSKM